jgi:hypothetical protein
MRRYTPSVLLGLCAVALAGVVLYLFDLRFELGDVYPPYSSLRSDPLGTMALYESLQALPGVTVERDFSTVNRLPEAPGTTYIHAATSADFWQRVPPPVFSEIEKFVSGGGRFVVTMSPTTFRNRGSWKPEVKSLYERWHFDFRNAGLDAQADGSYLPVTVSREVIAAVPSMLTWRSGGVFRDLGSDWKTIYSRNGEAVLIERALGSGTIVLATDSYFLSNEALQRDRHADLLLWLVSSSRHVVFDEAHFGVTDRPGVATLMRKYRLHGFLAALLVLAGLFIWKNSISFVPARADPQQLDSVSGKSASEGFDNLLRRSIGASELMEVCYAEWLKSAARSGRYPASRIRQAEDQFRRDRSLPEGRRDSVGTYREISRILKRKANEYREVEGRAVGSPSGNR